MQLSHSQELKDCIGTAASHHYICQVHQRLVELCHIGSAKETVRQNIQTCIACQIDNVVVFGQYSLILADKVIEDLSTSRTTDKKQGWAAHYQNTDEFLLVPAVELTLGYRPWSQLRHAQSWLDWNFAQRLHTSLSHTYRRFYWPSQWIDPTHEHRLALLTVGLQSRAERTQSLP